MPGKLLHVLISPERGGCETNALALCRALPSVEHHVLVILDQGAMSPDFEATASSVTYLKLGGKWWHRWIEPVRNAARAIAPSAAIFWHGMVALPQLICALHPLNVVTVAHAGNPAQPQRWRVDLVYWLMGLLYHREPLPTYVCCSQYVANSFTNNRYLSQFPKVVIHNGVKPVPDSLLHRVRSDTGEPFTVGMLARLDRIKDHATLLQAFARVLDQVPQARLEIAGDGELRTDLEALTRDLGVQQSVIFHGSVPHPQEVMRNWDLFVYATTENEGMGSALAEAMMQGLPCIATDIGPISEVAGSPAAVRLVPPRNAESLAAAVIAVAQDGALREQLSTQARRRALAAFSSETFASSYAKTLRLSD